MLYIYNEVIAGLKLDKYVHFLMMIDKEEEYDFLNLSFYIHIYMRYVQEHLCFFDSLFNFFFFFCKIRVLGFFS